MRIFSRYFLSIFFLVTMTLALVAGVLFLNSKQLMDEMSNTSAGIMNNAFLEQIEEQGQNLAGVVAEAVVTPVMLREYVTLQDILAAAKTQQQIEFAYVYDDRGRIIHDGTETLDARGIDINAIVAATDPFNRQVVWAKDKELLYCLAPIKIQDTLLGGVCIGLSLHNINSSVARLETGLSKIRHAAFNKNIQVLSILAGIILLISLGNSYLLARHLAMPIKELASFVGRIRMKANEDLLPTSRTDEVGMLARELSILSKDLKATTVSRDHFSRVLNSMPDGVLVTDSEGLIVMANQSALQLLSATENELTGKDITHVIPLYAAGITQEEILPSEAQEGFELSLETNGRTIPCLASSSCILQSNGTIEGYVFALHDITNRKEAEQIIAAQKERLDVTLRSIGDGVITTDIQGQIVFMNRMAEKMTGHPQSEAQGKPLLEIFRILDENTLEPRPNPLEKAVKEQQVVTIEDGTILEMKDGGHLDIADSCAPIRNSAGEIMGAVLVFSDITEKKKLHEESQKAEKLESLGMLAGGIAHDFNNILTAILGNLSYLRLKYKAEQDALDKLSLAEKATLKARSLTQQLLTFSKGGAPITKATSIMDLIKETAQFSLQGANVRGEFDLPGDLWPVVVDTGQISQVINNLVFNAIQAMPEGGIVTLSAKNCFVEDNNQLSLTPGKYVEIKVADKGAGIPQKHLAKIFDPYFTTKDMGYGLGLSTTYSIIKKHRGHIFIESEEAKGTTVTFYLPASEKTDLKKEKSIRHDTLKGKGNILLMDDDALVREITAELLEYLGYSTVLTEDGVEAIERYKEAKNNGHPFDAVIMDLTVPGGMGGKDAVRELREFDPDVKAIVASGYSNDPVMANYKEYGFIGVIVKPYTVEKMQELLHSLLA